MLEPDLERPVPRLQIEEGMEEIVWEPMNPAHRIPVEPTHEAAVWEFRKIRTVPESLHESLSEAKAGIRSEAGIEVRTLDLNVPIILSLESNPTLSELRVHNWLDLGVEGSVEGGGGGFGEAEKEEEEGVEWICHCYCYGYNTLTTTNV